MNARVETFLTYEDELQRLTALSGAHYPNVTKGWKHLFGSLSRWWEPTGSSILLPDPALNLSLPFARDELTIAMALGSQSDPTETDVETHARDFGIEPELLDRPVVTLSGGERMLVSLSKLAALAGYSKRSVACSPFFWLDSENRQYVRAAFQAQRQKGTEAFLLVLVGETEEKSSADERDYSLERLNWTLRCRSPRVDYPSTVLPRRTKGKSIIYISETEILNLESPTVMTGANGVGKTTLAKLLAGVREVAQGSIKVVTEAFGGQGRLLLQDPLLHLFSMSPREHLLRVFAHDQERRERAFDLFEDLEAQCACTLKEHNACITVGHRDEPSSILQAKLVLAAERLVTPTPLLIIDEPGWCLSRPVARVFLSTVTDCAHARGTAVLAISNQASWWQGISRDYLSLVEKEGRIRVEQGQR